MPEARREAAEEVREGVASEAVPRDVRLGDPLHDVHRHARRPRRQVLRPVVGGVRVPYPVPFRLLGDEARGYLDTSYVSDRLRVSKGNKGTTFIFARGADAAGGDGRAAGS